MIPPCFFPGFNGLNCIHWLYIVCIISYPLCLPHRKISPLWRPFNEAIQGDCSDKGIVACVYFGQPQSIRTTCQLWPCCSFQIILDTLEATWLPFCKQHFEMHFLERNFLYLNLNFTEICSWMSSSLGLLVQIMAWCQTWGKSSSEPIIAKFSDAYHRFSQKWQLRVCKWNFRVCKMPLLMKIPMKMKELGWF